jgi:hypothetical protein
MLIGWVSGLWEKAEVDPTMGGEHFACGNM